MVKYLINAQNHVMRATYPAMVAFLVARGYVETNESTYKYYREFDEDMQSNPLYVRQDGTQRIKKGEG